MENIEMDILIRSMERIDYEAIYGLIKNELGYSDSNRIATYARIEAIQSRKDYQTFVAMYQDSIVGFIGVCKGIAFNYDGEYLQIIALAVKEEFQNKGIGKQLIDKAEQYAKDTGIASIIVNSGLYREKAHIFYEHKGYMKKSYSFYKNL